jgi:hypothetical protein
MLDRLVGNKVGQGSVTMSLACLFSHLNFNCERKRTRLARALQPKD